MTPEEFLDAVAKGLGRAILHLREADPAPYRHIIRRAALRSIGYNQPRRGLFLYDMACAASMEAEITELIVRHLGRGKQSDNRKQRWDVARVLAQRGYEAVRAAMYQCFDPHDKDLMGIDEIVEVYGIAGLERVLDLLGGLLPDDELWRWLSWQRLIPKIEGQEQFQSWLQNSAHPGVRQGADTLHEIETRPEWKPRSPDRRPFHEVRAALLTGTERQNAVAWSDGAQASELRIASAEFETTQDERLIRFLSLALRRDRIKSYPGNMTALLQRCREPWREDEWNPFVGVAANYRDSDVAQLGLELLNTARLSDALDLLEENAMTEDIPLIIQAVTKHSPSNNEEMHSVAMSVRKIANDVETEHDKEMLLWSYENTPCSECREYTVRDLVELHICPKSILEECLLDCSEETREFAQTSLQGSA